MLYEAEWAFYENLCPKRVSSSNIATVFPRLSVIASTRAFSAKTDRRPDFQRMIKDSSKKAFEMIIVPRIGRTLAVNENTFSCFSIENEECIGHAILFYMKVSFVLGNEIIVIEQVL